MEGRTRWQDEVHRRADHRCVEGGAEAGTKAADLVRRHGVSDPAIYSWKPKYGGLELSEAKRLKALETPAAKRQAVAHLQACHGRASGGRAVSSTPIARACATARRGDEADLRERLRELAGQRRRFGDHRLHILPRRGA
jgi:putative transposase